MVSNTGKVGTSSVASCLSTKDTNYVHNHFYSIPSLTFWTILLRVNASLPFTINTYAHFNASYTNGHDYDHLSLVWPPTLPQEGFQAKLKISQL